MGIMIEPPDPAESGEPDPPTPLAAYLRVHPWCTEYVRLLLRNSAKRASVDTSGWPT